MNREFKRRKKNTHIDLQAIKQYLLHGTYPRNFSQVVKRSARKRAERFRVEENKELYYIVRPKRLENEPPDPNPEANKDNYRKVIMTPREQLAMTARIHVMETGAHMGMERTLSALTSKYYWVGMACTVNKVIKNCVVCVMNRRGITAPVSQSAVVIPQVISSISSVLPSNEFQVETDTENVTVTNIKDTALEVMSELQNPEEEDSDLDFDANSIMLKDETNLMANSDMLKAQQFWERVEIRIINTSDEGQNKKKAEDGRRKRKPFVIVALDSFSKWPEAKKLDKVNEQTVSQFVIQLIARFGVMGQLVVLEDDVTNDESMVLSGLIENLGFFQTVISHETINPYDQHWIQMSKIISYFVRQYPDSWASCLDLCLMPIRNSVSPKTDYSPAFVALARDPVFPSFLLPSKDSVNSEIMLSQQQIESAIESIMRTYHCCSEADVKRVIPPAESTPIMTRKIVVNEEELVGVRRSGRKLTVSHRLVDFETGIAPFTEHGKQESLMEDDNDAHSMNLDEDVSSFTVSEVRLLGDNIDGMDDTSNDTCVGPVSRNGTVDDVSESSMSLSVSNRLERTVRVGPGRPAKKSSSNEEDFLSKMDVDVYYKIIRNHIEKGTYPPRSPDQFKRVVRNARKGYTVENGDLMHQHKDKKKTVPMTLRERLQILKEVHTSTGGHVPRNRMIEDLDKRMTYWKNMVVDIGAFVKACPDCKHGQARPRLKKTARNFAWQDRVDIEEDEQISGQKGSDCVSYPDMIQYLESGAEPILMSRAELVVFKKRAKNFRLVKGALHYCLPNARGKPRKVLLTESERYEAMRKAHGDSHALAGHMMVDLQRLYYWRPMTNDVENFLASCCQPETEIKEKKDDELRQKTELFQRYFQGEDICGAETSLDSIFSKSESFPNSGDKNNGEVVDTVAVQDDQTGEVTSQGQTEATTVPIANMGLAESSMQSDQLQSSVAQVFRKSELDTSVDHGGIEANGMEEGRVGMEESEGDGGAKGEATPQGNAATGKKKGVKMRCEICKAIVTGENSFKEHMYKHTGIKPFTCPVCSRKYTSIKGMRLHMRKHTGHRPYLCNICGRGFPRSASLRFHIKTHERGVTGPVVCDVCNRIFTSEHRLKKHKRFKHPAQIPVYKCDTCGKHFTAKRSLKRHQEAHQGIRRYTCGVCKRSFFRKEYLTYHLNSHYKDNPALSHLTTKRKFRRRGVQSQESEKGENSRLLSILTTVPTADMGTEEVYTHLVEVTNTQPWVAQGEAQEGNAIPAVFGLDGTLQVGEVMEQVGGVDSPIVMVEDHGHAATEGMEIHHVIMDPDQGPETLRVVGAHELSQVDHHHHHHHHHQAEEEEEEDTKNLQITELHHHHLQDDQSDQPTVLSTQDSGHIEMTLSNGHRLTLARTGGITMGSNGQETVQYRVECLSGEALTEADLSAIQMLAQASVLPQ